MKNILITLIIIFTCVNTLVAEIKLTKPTIEENSAFAIVVDAETYRRIEDEILEYRDAVQEEDKLSVYLIVTDNERPEKIKEELYRLHKADSKLEGAVFIGDIPIPMIRGAQHMTSAFKMSEERDWIESSVPSDRYYDDFDLRFKFLKQDKTNSQLYYYELTPESPQKIDKDIYSGRIKPPVEDVSKYELIADYLKKAVAAKRNPEVLDKGLVYTGHGYHSESLTSWKDEAIALREQFPLMFKAGGRFKHLRESMNDDMKETLMLEMDKGEYDIAIFHAHGSENAQYILGYPPAESIQQNVEAIRRFVRSKIRAAKARGRDVEELKNYYKDKYFLTEEWFEGTFEDSVITADSIAAYKLDIYSDDLDLFSSNAEFMIFDQCFNGAFHVENYIAGRYLFGDGNVITGIAGSIGVLQDLWANKSLGLLGYGLNVGHWFDQNNYLEHHILGDPTFHFKKTYEVDLNEKIREEGEDADYWRSLITADEDEIRALAIVKLYELEGNKLIEELIEIYENDFSFNVRAHVFSIIAETRSPEFEKLLTKTIEDPFEYIRRMSAKLMGEIGSDKYIPYMIKAMIHDESSRVGFGTGRALGQMRADKVKEYAVKYIEQLPDYVDKKTLKSKFERMVDYNRNNLFGEIIPQVQEDTLKLSKRLFFAKMLRNTNYVEAINPMLEWITSEDFPIEIRIVITEALGWYYYNEKREEIIKTLDKLTSMENVDERLLKEAVKTKNRLLTGSNVALTP